MFSCEHLTCLIVKINQKLKVNYSRNAYELGHLMINTLATYNWNELLAEVMRVMVTRFID